MTKAEELADPNSCFNKAKDDEFVFVLLERDPAVPMALRAWAVERVRLGKNSKNDDQIKQTIKLAKLLEDKAKEKRE